jgi:hypothetical protein
MRGHAQEISFAMQSIYNYTKIRTPLKSNRQTSEAWHTPACLGAEAEGGVPPPAPTSRPLSKFPEMTSLSASQGSSVLNWTRLVTVDMEPNQPSPAEWCLLPNTLWVEWVLDHTAHGTRHTARMRMTGMLSFHVTT